MTRVREDERWSQPRSDTRQREPWARGNHLQKGHIGSNSSLFHLPFIPAPLLTEGRLGNYGSPLSIKPWHKSAMVI